MNQAGFSLLVMGFTGEKALMFKYGFAFIFQFHPIKPEYGPNPQ